MGTARSRMWLVAILLATMIAKSFHPMPASAAAVSRAPMLRVETGAHTGRIFSIATDAANQYLVSGGDDKTVRLWSLPQLELLKTLRPPIGDRMEGRVDTVAMAPDGTRVAVGGEFCRPYEGRYCAFIFDTASGRVVKRLSGFPERVRRLEWSPDGRAVAVGMIGRAGLRLLRTDDWSEIGRDADYADYVSAMHFDGRGRLATTSWDGKIRVYAYDRNSLTLRHSKAAADLQHTLNRNAQNRGRPSAVRFSPDGARLAVGHTAGSNWVVVLSPDTLETLITTYARRGVICSLAWTPDGNTLYAGIGDARGAPRFIRKWGDGGRGVPTDLPAGNADVWGLSALQDGSVVFATLDADMGRYDSRGDRTAFLTARSGNFYGSTEAFKVSRDGARVEFAYGGGQDLLNFDTVERKLGPGLAKDPSMAAPVVNSRSLMFYNLWRDTRGALEIGGRLLAMSQGEVSRSLAIAPDQSSVVVGTNFFVRHFSRDGALLWATPANAYAVNVSGDGRLIVAALGDGTIRWYRRGDGRLLLTLFVASDRKRWALVSPSGFYDASVGGEDLIGWHVNRGRDEAADFFPVSRLRARFYRPEVVAGIITKADDAEAFRLAAQALGGDASVVLPAAPATQSGKPAPPKPVASPAPAPPAAPIAQPEKPTTPATPPGPAAQPDQRVGPQPVTKPAAAAAGRLAAEEEDETSAVAEAPSNVPTAVQIVSDVTRVLPPVITVLSPASGSAVSSNQVPVRYTVRTEADAPVTSVRARVNGLAEGGRGPQVGAGEEVREITVTIPFEDSEITLFAENKYGISMPAVIRLNWRGAKASPPGGDKPVLYVLAIGVSNYQNPEYRLHYAAKDAGDFVGIVQQQKGRHYSDVVVKLLTDDSAGNASVIDGFEWLQKQVTRRDVGMVFIAGHGVTDDHGAYFYLPFNADLDALPKTSVPFNEIKSRLANLRGRGLMFVDTCYSGSIMGKRKGLSNDINGLLNELSSMEYGLVVIASSTGKQVSLESESWGNGAFTKALVEGLAGNADLKKRGRITHKMLDFYVSDRVEELTKGRQTPVNSSPQGVPDYTIAVVASGGV